MKEERGKDGSEGLAGVSFQDTEKWFQHMNCKDMLSWEVIWVEMCYELLAYMAEGVRLVPLFKCHWRGEGTSRLQMCSFKMCSQRSK